MMIIYFLRSNQAPLYDDQKQGGGFAPDEDCKGGMDQRDLRKEFNFYSFIASSRGIFSLLK